MHNTKRSGIIQTMFSALLFGFTPCLCSITYALGNSTASMTFFRNLLILPIVFGIIIRKRIDLRVDRTTFIKIWIVANLGTLLTTLLLYSSYSFISVGMATTIHFMYPILVVVFCRLFYKEVITSEKVLSIVLAFAGIVMFLVSNRSDNAMGIILAFLSSITFALYMMLLDKLKISQINSYKFIFYASAITVVEMFLVHLKTGYIIFKQQMHVYGLMFVIAILTSLVATCCLKEGVRILGSSMASFISLLEPVSSIMFGVLLLKESVSVLQLAGCTLIIISIVNLTGVTKAVGCKKRMRGTYDKPHNI